MIKSENATHVYVAYKSCGCMVGVATDLCDKDTARYVADFIKSGCTIERLTFEAYRSTSGPRGCKCATKKQSLLDLSGAA